VLHSTPIHDRVIEFSSPKNLSSLSVAGSVPPALADDWGSFSKGDINIWLLFKIFILGFIQSKAALG
jgi:hypothetical protein